MHNPILALWHILDLKGIHIHLSSLYSEQNFLKNFIALIQYSQHPNNIISIMLEPQPIPRGGGTAALATHPPPNMVPPVPFDGTCIAREGESCQRQRLLLWRCTIDQYTCKV